jgi:hypothetical protein
MNLEGLDDLTSRGRKLLDADGAVKTHASFRRWVNEVEVWIRDRLPDSGLASEWAGLGSSNLVLAGGYHDDPASWLIFRGHVENRLRWLGQLPTSAALKGRLGTLGSGGAAARDVGPKSHPSSSRPAFVAAERIAALKRLPTTDFDYTRLIRLCEELNLCWTAGSFIATIVLTRAVLDHIPPHFGARSFAEVVNNHCSGRSIKEVLAHLDKSSRKIADHYLHDQIRKAESLPNETQANASSALDVLLAEMLRDRK